jgi:hypothetical protein
MVDSQNALAVGLQNILPKWGFIRQRHEQMRPVRPGLLHRQRNSQVLSMVNQTGVMFHLGQATGTNSNTQW